MQQRSLTDQREELDFIFKDKGKLLPDMALCLNNKGNNDTRTQKS